MGSVGSGSARVLYVGPDTEVADWVEAGFERADRAVEFATEPGFDAALERVRDAQEEPDPRMRSPLVDSEEPFDCVVCGDGPGVESVVSFVERLREDHPDLPVVLFAERGSERLASEAITAGVSDYHTADGDDPTGTLADRALELVADFRERTERRREMERAERIVEHNPEILTVFEPGGQIAYQNPTAREVLGYGREEMVEGTPFAVVHPDDWQSIREEFYDAIRDPEYVPEVEYRIRDSDGEWRTVRSRGRNMLHDPLVNGVVVTTRDVTERRERERDLEAYRQVVENVGDGMYVLDPEGYIKMVNDAFLEHTGYDRDFVEGAHVSTFMRKADVEEGAELIADLLANPDQDWGRFEFVAENVEGEFRRYEDNVAVLLDDDGNFRGSVGVIRDVTDGQ